MLRFVCCLLMLAILGSAQPADSTAQEPFRLAIIGLVHSHVDGFLSALRNRKDVEVVGVFDPDPGLHRKYGQLFHLPDSVFFDNLASMLERTRPEALATFTSTYDHAMAVEAAASRKIPVMMEKPLAVDMKQARAIQRMATSAGIPVIVNYETTWYKTHAAMWTLFKQNRTGGEIRKMVAMDGHQGPQEIGVPPEFLSWLTDPVKNGAGALYDFGCYGANLMTWMMDNQRPLAVSAMTLHIKPRIYPKVEDEATILVEYPRAQGIIQASWNWPVSRKDFEVYTEHAYAIATGGNVLRVRTAEQGEEEVPTLPELMPDQRDSVSYLAAVTRGKLKPEGLSSLENNMIVTEILESARESARTGKTIRLAAH